MPEKLKIAVIGGGSSYTPELIEGIIDRLNVLPVKEIVLVDIVDGEKNLEIITKLAIRMVEKSPAKLTVTSTFNLNSALRNCSFVITQFRVGGLKARALDEKIPLSLNMIGQETTGAGGFAKALRTIPVVLDIAKRMERICPEAWLINFTNPAGILTEAVLNNSNINCLGLCNVPLNMERDLANRLFASGDDLYCKFVGLNHLSWIKQVFVKGEDRTPAIFNKIGKEKRGSIVANISEIEGADKLIKSLKLLPSPYLNYYYFEKRMLKKEKQAISEGKGTRAEQVMKIEKTLFKIYSDPELAKKPVQLSERGGSLYSEAALSLIESLYADSGKTHVVNLLNNGAIKDLPDNVVVETNCVVSRSGAKLVTSESLPLSIRGLVQSVKAYEQLTIQAAITKSKEIAFVALLNNPLVHDANNAQILLERFLEAHKKYLSYLH